jgi:prephenate dehydrogenase
VSERKTLCVIGLGLIGGSLAASLKAIGGPWHVRAADRRRNTLEHALRGGFIDEAAESLEEGVQGADIVVVATPVRAIRTLLTSLGRLLQPGQVVTDVGSTKRSIVETARRELPESVGFVGGHPIAGTEFSGAESAVPGLFEGRPCILTPDAGTPRESLEAVIALWRSLGAEVVLLEPAVHDRVFALVSHMPHMVAYSIMNTVAAELPGREAELGGGSFRDFTRVTSSSPTMWRDICLENREGLVQALDAFSERLSEVRGLILSGDGEGLAAYFQRAALARGKPWLT